MAELVASVRKYKDRDSVVEWLKELPMKYSSVQLRNILQSSNHGKLLLWSLENIPHRKTAETIVFRGVTIL
jgi:hypothetical protein